MLQAYPSSVSDQSLGACWYNDSLPEGRPVWPADGYMFQQNDYRPVTVIGGGYTGLSALYHLVSRKSISPLGGGGRPGAILLEAKQIGCGPSGNSGGHICWLQANYKQMLRACGRRLTERLSVYMEGATDLVEKLVRKHDIPCDFTRGYAELCDGRWNVTKGGRLGWLAPYPFVLGLAAAAQKTGRAEILENTLVTNVEQVGRLCRVTTDRGSFWTSYVVAAGGHRMAETIPVLSGQRAQTVEIYVSSLLIGGIPKQVLDHGLPHKVLDLARRFGQLPFADGSPSNVIFGVIDYKHGRIMVGSRDTTDGSVPDLNLMSRDLFYLFPKLEALLAKTGVSRDLLVAAMPVSVPINQMPIVAQNGVILSVQGLAGHGLAAGVLLGKAAAKKIFALVRNDRDLGQTFDDFGMVRHLTIPPLSHPIFRGWAAYAGQKLHHCGVV